MDTNSTNRNVLLIGTLFLSLFGQANAVILAPGTTAALPGTSVAANPSLAGTVIVDELTPFSFSAYGGTVSGNVQIRIVDAIDNTLDFYWRVFNDANSAGSIGSFRFGNFVTPTYDANYRTDGLGDIAPDSAHRFTDGVNFLFSGTNELLAGMSSNFFFMDTDATNYARTGIYDLTGTGTGGISSPFEMYAPAASPVPEPSSLALIGLGLAALGFARRKKTA